MVYRRISSDMKCRALQLLAEGWELRRIADIFGVSLKSVDRWFDNYEVHGRVDPPFVNQGRRRLLTQDVIGDMQELLLETPDLYLDEIAEWLLLYHDLPISTTALHNNLRNLGFSRKLMQRTAAERDHELRAAWMYDVLATYTAEQFVVLDESSKDGRTLFRRYGRAVAGSRASAVVPLERGIRYSILPALTVDGYIAVRAVEGSIDGLEFFDFVVEDVVGSSSLVAFNFQDTHILPLSFQIWSPFLALAV
jgi:transposase